MACWQRNWQCTQPPATARRRRIEPDRRERERRGHRRASRGHRDRDHQGGRAEEVAGKDMGARPAEDHQHHQDECRHPDRRPGVADHGQPLFACRSRLGRAPLPSTSWIPQRAGKVKTLRRPAVSAA